MRSGIRQTTAVTKPWFGDAPLAMPSAMARGSATMATVSPARASLRQNFLIWPSRQAITSFGVNAGQN